MRLTDLSEIDNIKTKFKPYNTVWNLARDYFYKVANWMSSPIGDMERDKIP